mgnify:CR=1 FL=1
MRGFLISCLVLFASQAWSQDITVTGVVRDAETNDLIPGVNVIVKNTTTGTSTDFDGNFVLSGLSAGDVLVFSYIGFLPKEYTVRQTETISISMQEDVSALDEVVVIGYGTQRKKEITGAVSVVGSATNKEINPTRVEQALQQVLDSMRLFAREVMPKFRSREDSKAPVWAPSRADAKQAAAC